MASVPIWIIKQHLATIKIKKQGHRKLKRIGKQIKM